MTNNEFYEDNYFNLFTSGGGVPGDNNDKTAITKYAANNHNSDFAITDDNLLLLSSSFFLGSLLFLSSLCEDLLFPGDEDEKARTWFKEDRSTSLEMARNS